MIVKSHRCSIPDIYFAITDVHVPITDVDVLILDVDVFVHVPCALGYSSHFRSLWRSIIENYGCILESQGGALMSVGVSVEIAPNSPD